MLAEQAPEVSAHGHAPFRRVHQRRGPFDGMDFGNEGGVHQPRLLEQPFAVGAGVVDAQPIHDRIVLAREQRVQQAETGPPIARKTGQRRLQPVVQGIGVEDQIVMVEVELAVRHELAGQH
jgi:hypothetical protein